MKGLNETKRASMHLLGFIDHEKAKGASLREISRTSNPSFHLSTWLGYIIWPLFAAGSCSLPFNKQDVENESNDSTTETIVTSTKGRIVFSKNAQKKTCRRQKTSVSPPSRFYPLGSALDDTLRKWLLLGHSGRLETDPNHHHPQKTQFILLIFEGFPTQTHTSPFHIRVILFEDDGSSCFASHTHLFRREMWLGNEGYEHLTQNLQHRCNRDVSSMRAAHGFGGSS